MIEKNRIFIRNNKRYIKTNDLIGSYFNATSQDYEVCYYTLIYPKEVVILFGDVYPLRQQIDFNRVETFELCG